MTKREDILRGICSQICESDPLVLNELGELGELYFQKLKYAQSVDSFKNALKVAEETKCRPQRVGYYWIIFAKSSRYIGITNSDALTALGYIYHVKEVFEEAIMILSFSKKKKNKKKTKKPTHPSHHVEVYPMTRKCLDKEHAKTQTVGIKDITFGWNILKEHKILSKILQHFY
ncbi:hypothetical protein C2G38_2139826 [Gigaspora rosea]|uniref:Uncharacterized protein n=1 Tax=Gigaspora rosea TaxID=44941 RepID=A0A397VN50_9GLOM|nr:hypothetical protein C2G38_2139826 [Gigaspora rosea]